jgi:hypothetical protein
MHTRISQSSEETQETFADWICVIGVVISDTVTISFSFRLMAAPSLEWILRIGVEEEDEPPPLLITDK